MRGAMKMALIRNNYGYGNGGGATSRRRRDDRGRYMEGDWDAPRNTYTNYIEYDEYPTSARQMGFGEAYSNPQNERSMRGGYVRYNRADMNAERRDMSTHDVHIMNDRGGMHRMEDYRHQGGKVQPLTREKAEEWVQSMQNEDDNREEGECWTLDEVKELARKMGMPAEGKKLIEFYAAINAMYSDYYKVAERYGLVEDEFFAELAKAFINDKDAVKDKVAAYYQYIVDKN